MLKYVYLFVYRFMGIKKISLLRQQLEQMSGIVCNLKENKSQLSGDISAIQIAIGDAIQTIRNNPNIGRQQIEQK